MRLFQRKETGRGAGGQGDVRRASRGWSETLAFLKEREGLRVLDFGATSSTNINYLTSLGQSVYMANVVEDATHAEWMRSDPENPSAAPVFDGERFAAQNFDFSGKEFDVVLLWDTADYLPPVLVPLLFSRLHDVLHQEGRLLAFFHGKAEGPEAQFSRFHVADQPELMVHRIGGIAVQQTYQTRQIEKFLSGYSDVRFLLGKDNIREVIATR